ncbi:hypothetical protein AJ78_03178 [Emergomyces pasteurianus Ep9510]|uniref:Uncharacterized protein n=1 Tax=Emergomyces pasteurianus Ep9510 TaxID=1447872 RepID=A0A1J9QLB3_9EURO|nr:hypothetical protein AJ78_03178 [Emergomyces pasteurianus Ep9510]
MTGKLTLHNSPKRKRDDIDYQRRTVSTSPVSSHTSVSAKDGRLADEYSPAFGDDSPQISVAGELSELDLHGTSSHTLESTSHSASDDNRAIDKTDEEPSIRGAMNVDGQRIIALTASSGEEEMPQGWLGDGDLIAMSSAPAPQQNSKPNPAQKPRPRQKSPPLSNDMDENPLTWHDSEITGYAPTDPNDDGYGINGIGFKPTAAIAWDRSQRRKKQVADWKSREAKEARERRKSRRDGILVDEHTDSLRHICKKVKFDITPED